MFGKKFELLRNGNIRIQVLGNKLYDYVVQVTDLCSITCLMLAIFKPRKAFYFHAILLFSVKLPS